MMLFEPISNLQNFTCKIGLVLGPLYTKISLTHTDFSYIIYIKILKKGVVLLADKN